MSIKIIETNKYEELAAEWQYQMIIVLKETLEKHKIDIEKSKEICGDFSFNFGMLHDQGKIKLDNEEFRPVICFDNLEEDLYYNSVGNFEFHDYAFGNTDEAFES